MVLRAHDMVRRYHYLGDMIMLHGDEWEPVERALMKGYKVRCPSSLQPPSAEGKAGRTRIEMMGTC